MSNKQLISWQTKKLGDICIFHRGLIYKKGEEVASSQNIVLRANNIALTTFQLDLSELKYLDGSKEYDSRKKVKRDSLLICTASGSKKHLGKVALIEEDLNYFFGGFMGLLVPDTSQINPKYFYQTLTSFAFRKHIDDLMDGANINNLKFSLIENFEIPLPPLEEQERIVDILDEKFAALARAKEIAEQNLQNSKELFESTLQEVFGNPGDDWEERQFSEIFGVKHGFAFKSKYFEPQGEYVLLTPGNFFEKGGYKDRGNKQKYYTGKIPEGYILSKGDLLVAMTEQAPGLLGSSIIIPHSGRFLHNQRLGLIQYHVGAKVNSNFLFYLFNTPRIRSEIHKDATGVKVRHTSPYKIMMLKAYFPSYLEQENIVAKLDKISAETKRLGKIYKQKLENLDELKKSILAQAFNGEL